MSTEATCASNIDAVMTSTARVVSNASERATVLKVAMRVDCLGSYAELTGDARGDERCGLTVASFGDLRGVAAADSEVASSLTSTSGTTGAEDGMVSLTMGPA